ncbi:MAG: hypothetical protein LJE83_06600 [Gammaproteobacteria bacterium]|jgi:hypothetical protein|nr:hypothetical protein [Gammaproteobacteria bacterium]
MPTPEKSKLINPATIYVTFRVTGKYRIKARLAGNGYSIDKSRNAEPAFSCNPYVFDIEQERPDYACPWTALSALAVEWLQRRADALRKQAYSG